MTKAERIFKENYIEARLFVKKYGFTGGEGFTHLSDELIYKRTENAIRKEIASERKKIETSKKLGVIEEDKYTMEMNAVQFVENTLNNTYIA